MRKSDDFWGAQPLKNVVYTSKINDFPFFHWVSFWFPKCFQNEVPGHPKTGKSGVWNIIVFRCCFWIDFWWKMTSKRYLKVDQKYVDKASFSRPASRGCPGLHFWSIFDDFGIDVWVYFWWYLCMVCRVFYLFSFAFTIGFRGYCCGIDVWFLQYWCGMMWNFLWCCWGIAVILLWRDCGISVIAVWIPTILLWYCCEIALVLLWSCCGFPMVAVGLKFGGAGDCCGIDVGFMWNSCGIDVESPETLLGIAVILLW